MPESFIKRLLGLGDLTTLFKTVNEAFNSKKQKKMVENIQEGKFTMRDMREQYRQVLNMGPLGQVVSMIPGLSQNMIPKGQEKEATARIKRFLFMMDSMNKAELDSEVEMTPSRIIRIAKGSGCHPMEVKQLVEDHKRFQHMVKGLSGLKMDNPADLKKMMANPGNMMKNLQGAMDPKMLQSMGGMGNVMDIMKQMSTNEDMQGMMQ